jgi:SAM-dependent methyltransferase
VENSPGTGESDAHSGARVPWKSFADFYSRLGPPLTPSPSDAEAIRQALPAKAGQILLLGVTPQLSRLGSDIVAVDNSPKMLAQVWPGDSEGRRAILGDWTALPFPDQAFSAAIGDAPLNAAPFHAEQVVAEVARVLAPDGRFIFRAFCSPAESESLETIAEDVWKSRAGNLHSLKWRIAMSLAASRPRAIVAVADILAAFDSLFPDRSTLARMTGWPAEEIATLDAYVGADHSLGFPTLKDMLELVGTRFSEVSVIDGIGYPLAECSPTIVCASPSQV